jgi:RNA polymerase sigma factor (sigma-70 family)
VTAAPALWTKHRTLAHAIAHDYYLPGQDRDDVRQKALIALWEAARRYDPAKGSFPAFARVVIRNHLIDAIDKANRANHRLLDDAARDIDTPVIETERGQLALILDALPRLSELERASLARSLNGEPTTGDKRFDNALQRARKKLREAA